LTKDYFGAGMLTNCITDNAIMIYFSAFVMHIKLLGSALLYELWSFIIAFYYHLLRRQAWWLIILC